MVSDNDIISISRLDRFGSKFRVSSPIEDAAKRNHVSEIINTIRVLLTLILGRPQSGSSSTFTLVPESNNCMRY